jgi:uridine kinase
MEQGNSAYPRKTQMKGVTIIGICGGSGSGKTTLALRLARELGKHRSLILFQDSYYIDQSGRFDGDGCDVNFDHPASLEFDLLAKHLQDLKNNLSIQVPSYDFTTHKRRQETELVSPKQIVIVDGTLILSQECVRKLCDVTIFIETPEETRFARRLRRDTAQRGRTPEGVYKQFRNHVQPMHDEFVEPSKQGASYILGDSAALEMCLNELLKTLISV